ncbi:MAG TPA: alpha/beta hydrolase [Acetobacteraceae bacterium]|nr:alpha/beta hydrolase [Acetobacteraceae bacterium]
MTGGLAASGWGPSGGLDFVQAPDGVRVAVYEWGDPAGPEVLLIHGFCQCHLCFSAQLASDLARDFRLVAYDLRGHGASDKPTDPQAYQGPDVWAQDLAAIIAAKRLRRPVLVGWSMGGRVIRQYLMRHGDAGLAGINFVSSLVIEDPRARGTAASRGRTPGPQPLAQQIQAAIAFLDNCFAIKPDEATFRLALGYNMLVPQSIREAIGGWATDSAATVAALGRVRVPTLITHGRQDTIVLPVAAEMAAQAITGSRISWYEACGHSPFHENAARFNAELSAFVTEVAG